MPDFSFIQSLNISELAELSIAVSELLKEQVEAIQEELADAQEGVADV